MSHDRYRCSVLVLDDEPAILSMLRHQLAAEFDVRTAGTVEAAKAAVAEAVPDIVCSDLQLAEGSGLAFLDWVRHTAPRAARILLTGTARLEDAAEAINTSHIHRFVLKPWRPEDLVANLKTVADAVLLERRHELLVEKFRELNAELEGRVIERTEQLQAKTRELQLTLAELEHKNQILEKMALTDPLTGLPNRRAIDLIARKELLRRARTPAPIVLILIDADHFGQVNKDHTQIGGDHVLIWLSGILQNSIRVSDSLGRVGGEE